MKQSVTYNNESFKTNGIHSLFYVWHDYWKSKHIEISALNVSWKRRSAHNNSSEKSISSIILKA
jgi:hypothetical protein